MSKSHDCMDCDSAMAPRPPRIKDVGSFTMMGESFEDDGSGNLAFKCTKLLLIDQTTHRAWVGTANIPKKQLKLEQAVDCLRPVPNHHIYPTVTPDLPLVVSAKYVSSPDDWIKRPDIFVYSQVAGTTMIADDFMEEIRILQTIHESPHPNIVKFKGCIEDADRVVAVLLKRYRITLEVRVEGYNQPAFDARACLREIEAGIEHLHSLGLAHNDLNPSNIMVNEHDKPVIVDMGSCRRIGQELHQMGTPDWNEGFEECSSVVNDQIGLECLSEWLLNGRERSG
ncbi:serine/threonine-protein kinase [Apiospora arundinis]